MSRRVKKLKDTNAPKRPQSSYFIFSNKRRKEMKETNPDKKLTEISKMIAAEWKKMDGASKKPYEEDAKTLKAKYEVDMQKYKTTKEFKDFQKKVQEHKQSEGNGKSKGKKNRRKTKENEGCERTKKAAKCLLLVCKRS